MYKRLEVGGKEYHLRIRAKHVEELNKWLKKSYRDAVIDTFEDPVSNVVPFLWAACQQGSDQKPFSREDAHELYDQLVDEGFDAWEDLVIEICRASGFFRTAVADGMQATVKTIQVNMEKTMDKMVKGQTKKI